MEKRLFIVVLTFLLATIFISGCIIEQNQQQAPNTKTQIKELTNQKQTNEDLGIIDELKENETRDETIEQEQSTKKDNNKPTSLIEQEVNIEKVKIEEVENQNFEKKNALKIIMLKKGESLEVGNWELFLEDIKAENGVYKAQYSIYMDGIKQKTFELENLKVLKLTFANGRQYYLTEVFDLGQKTNAVQVQVYDYKAPQKSTSTIEVGEIKYGYILNSMFPLPTLIEEKDLKTSEYVQTNYFKVYFYGVDKEQAKSRADILVTDKEDKEIVRWKLYNQQMFEIKTPSEKYAVLIDTIDDEKLQLKVKIYKINAFK
jgi:hypothetical protein